MDRRKDYNKWMSGTAMLDDYLEAAVAMRFFDDSAFKELILTRYSVNPKVEFTYTGRLEKISVLDWINHLYSSGDDKRNLLYRMAEYLYEKYGSLNMKTSDGIAMTKEELKYLAIYDVQNREDKQTGKWNTKVKAILGVDGMHPDEKALANLIISYIEFVGKQGIEGFVQQEEAELPEDINHFGDLYNLFEVFNYVRLFSSHVFRIRRGHKYVNPLDVYETISEQNLFVKNMMMRIMQDKEFCVRETETKGGAELRTLDDIMENSRNEEFVPEYPNNTNLGTEELMNVFMKHGSMKHYEKNDGSRALIEYEDEKDIADFIYDLMDTQKKVNDPNYTTNRFLRNNIECFRADESTYDTLIGGIVNKYLGYDFSGEVQEILSDVMQERLLVKGGRIMDLFGETLYESVLSQFEVVDKEKSYLQIRMTELLVEKTLWDYLLLWNGSYNYDLLGHYVGIQKLAYKYSHESLSLLIQPQDKLHDYSIHEKYAFELSRKKEIRKYLRYKDILNSIMTNYLFIMDNFYFEMPNVSEYNGEDIRMDSLTDSKLAELLEGGRVGNMKQRKERVYAIGEWITRNGYLGLNLNWFKDFKAVYDVVYKFKPASLLKKSKIEIKVNSIKALNNKPEELSKDMQLYIVLGVFVAKLFNKTNREDRTFLTVCEAVMDIIDNIITLWDIKNYDQITIQANAVRAYTQHMMSANK